VLKLDIIQKVIAANKKEDIAATIQKFLEIVTRKYLQHIKAFHLLMP